jgi:cytoskeletal protein CcmA (bactofilin family)
MEQTSPGWTQRVLRRPRSLDDPENTEEAELEVAAPKLTVIEQGCALEGRLVVDRPVRIEGELRGSIVSSESVCVAASGTVEGEIRARSIEIYGAVVGNVTGTREVILQPNGKLHGDVETSSFVVERRAYFNGRTSMHLPQLASRDRPTTQEPAEAPTAPSV